MTTKDFRDYVLDCLSDLPDVFARPMMGGYCLYYRGRLVGNLCDNRLLIKQTETSERLLAGCALEYPYEGSKQMMFAVEDPEDRDRMRELFEGMYFELPERKSR